MKQQNKPSGPRRGAKGFQRTASLLEQRIRKAGESRGFAVSRLLTHWSEIVGEATAQTAHPLKVSYSRGGFGATLTLLTTSSQAPMLAMQVPQIRDKVNACYGYNAISRIKITQTAPTGFAEGQVAFAPALKVAPKPNLALRAQAHETTKSIENDTLRDALASLGENILNKQRG